MGIKPSHPSLISTHQHILSKNMRQNIFIRIVWTLIFLLCHHLYLAAQCPADVTLTAKVTKSVGPSDGSFTITTAVVGANSSSVTYSFEAIPLTPGASHPAPTSTFVINNLAPGTYDLVMKATCVHDNDNVITKTLKNLVVQGDYVLPTISESKLKQGSFDNCPMGILAVNVQNGGSTFTCTIKSAPAGVALGEVAYSVLPGANKSYEYILNGTYPAGTYTIDVSDQYGKGREINITLEQLTVADLPTIALPATWVHESFLPGPDCNHIYFRHIGQYNYQLTKEDFKKYYDKGEFEMAIAPTGKTPVHWAPITIPSIFHPEQLFDISPYTISDLHTHGISVFVRLKNCPTISNERQLKLSKPSFQHVGSQAQCEKYGWRIYEPNFRFQGLWCYPVTLTLHENSKTGPVVGTYTINSINDAVTMPVDYNKTWYVEASDGTNTWEAITFPERFVDYVKLQRQTFCNGWRKFYNLNTFAACVPLVIKIERESDGYAQSVQLIKNRTDFNYFGPSDTRGFDKVSDILEYGVDYRIKVYKTDSTTLLWSAPTTIRQDARTNAVQFRRWNPSSCGKHTGSLFLRFGDDGQEPPLRDADGKLAMSYRIFYPNGKEVPGYYSTFQSYTGTYFNTTTDPMPPGVYTLEETNLTLPEGDPCRVRKLTTTWGGMFDVKDFTYTSTTECGVLSLRPQGKIMDKGTVYEKNENTRFSIISGVKGGYTPNFLVKEGYPIELTKPGDYVLAIGTENMKPNCYLDTLHVHVQPLNFEVSRPHLKAYSCTNSATAEGHIEVKGIKGKEPITYELREMDGTTVVKSAPDDISPDGVAHFVAGVTGDKFMVYAKDACGQFFLEPVTVVSSQGMRIVPSDLIRVFHHSTVRLQSTYFFDTYEWRAPDGTIISTEQTFDLVDAHPSQSGLYHFTSKLRHCDYRIEADVNVQIHPYAVFVNPQLVSSPLRKIQ